MGVVDAKGALLYGHRQSERFALCSTFKLIAVAALLARVDSKEDRLDRFVTYSEKDLLEWAPATREHLREGGMRLGDLCAAAIELSDNTAANLIVAALGGPAAVTRFCRAHGDGVTRLDRIEPELNQVAPGDDRDTTTPQAMATLTAAVLFGGGDRAAALVRWLLEAKIGAERIPAGLPAGWRVGHKTGTGASGETNDVAIVWPPRGEPLVVAAYYAGSAEPRPQREAVLAGVGRFIASERFAALPRSRSRR